MMEVYCWAGDWELPSIDIDCLEVIAYIKFADAPVPLVPSRAPIVGHKVTDFPILKTIEGQYEIKTKKIIKYFEDMKFYADKWMKPSQLQDILALKAFVMDKLRPCLMYNMWLDHDNYSRIFRKIYSKKCIFPLNYIVPGRQYQNAKHLIEYTKVPKDKDLDYIKDQLHADAADCLNSLSSFLGDKEYFFGDRPCSLDALVFAHLAVLEKAPFSNSKLQYHLRGCDNLRRYVTRILRTQSVPELKEPITNTSTSGEEQGASSVLLPIGVGIIAMVSYAAHIGLLMTRNS